MKNIFDTLEDIKVKPELYLGAKNLTYLYHFINGYVFRSMDMNDYNSSKIREFHFWIPKKTGIDVENWLQNLLIKTNHNEEKAVDLFFQYIKIFTEEINFSDSENIND